MKKTEKPACSPGYGIIPSGNFKVVFKGFKTKEQAQAFASWYEGSGEQNSGDWLEASTDICNANVDVSKFTNKVNKNNEIIVPLKLYTKTDI